MMIEQNTNYAYALKHLNNTSFEKVWGLSSKFYNELPNELQDELLKTLNCEVDILDSEPQMATYMFSYGKMNNAILDHAFCKMPDFMQQGEICIVDYGCGQALGTMCFADFLHKNGYKAKVKTITLIEPSEICLKRAALHASAFFPNAEIRTVNKTFDELNKEDLIIDKNTPTLHIFSNVLHLDFDLEKLSDLIKTQIKNYNHFVCIGHFLKENKTSDFKSLMDGYRWGNDEIIYKTQNPEIKQDTIIYSFYVGRPPKVFSKEELENCIEDDFGVVYSSDGKLLLKCKYDIEEYTIKDNTVIIVEDAFKECSALKQITIPDTVTEIGNYAFEKCTSLQNIIIPDSVTRIELGAFSGCQSLTQIIIPDSVSRIEEELFCNCISLKYVIIPDSVSSIGPLAFGGCSSLKQINIPNSVLSIGYSAFIDCSSLQRIILSDSISVIEECTFSGCSSLEKITIPDSVSRIMHRAFGGCSSLKQIIIPNSIYSIEEAVFSGCSSLQQITIPNSVEEMGHNPFCYCDKLKLYSNSSRFIVKEGLLIDNFEGKVVSYMGNDNIIVIPDSVLSIGSYAFIHCGFLEQVVIPDSVEHIGENAFSNCVSLQQVTIPDSVTTIDIQAFTRCSSLKQITIPNSVEEIWTRAFYGCEALREITIPDSVNFIGSFAFSGCESLKQINIPKGSIERFQEMLDKELWDRLVEK